MQFHFGAADETGPPWVVWCCFCTKEAVHLNCCRLLHILKQLEPSITLEEMNQLMQRCTSSTTVQTGQMSQGCLIFTLQYIMNYCCCDNLTEHIKAMIYRQIECLLACTIRPERAEMVPGEQHRHFSSAYHWSHSNSKLISREVFAQGHWTLTSQNFDTSQD